MGGAGMTSLIGAFAERTGPRLGSYLVTGYLSRSLLIGREHVIAELELATIRRGSWDRIVTGSPAPREMKRFHRESEVNNSYGGKR